MKAKIILNPYAGRWNALKQRDKVIQALVSANIPFDLVTTNGPGHAITLAKQAAVEGYTPIVSAGGDGSISEVINGVMLAYQVGEIKEFPLVGVIPLGSANDLVDNLGLPHDIETAVNAISLQKIRRIDLCKVSWQIGDDLRVRYFDNNSAIGLEPHITLIQQKIKWIQGDTRYLLAVLKGILDKPLWDVQLEWQGGSYHGNTSLVTVGNSPRTGGLFYVTPHADPCDGLLTFVYAFISTRLKMLQILPKLMKPGRGNYVECQDIHEVHSPWLHISASSPVPLHADGEIQSTEAQIIDYQILPQFLSVITN